MIYPYWTLTKHVDEDESKVYKAVQLYGASEFFCCGDLLHVNKLQTFAVGVDVAAGCDCKDIHVPSLKGKAILFRRTKHKTQLLSMTEGDSIHQATVENVSPNGNYILLERGDWWPVDAIEILDVLGDAS